VLAQDPLAEPDEAERRSRSDRFRIVNFVNFTGASVATYVWTSVKIRSCVCSKTVYPSPCRQTYGVGPGAGFGMGDQNRPVSSSRT